MVYPGSRNYYLLGASILAFKTDFGGDGFFRVIKGRYKGGPLQVEEALEIHLSYLRGVVSRKPAEFEV